MINKSGRRFGAALAGCALLLTAACGGGGGGRPSTAQLEKALSKGTDSVFGSALSSVPSSAMDCIAKALHDSKLSDGALRAIVDNKKDYKGSKADTAALEGLQTDVMKCASDAAK
jgi:hypothetical protein